MQKRYLISPLVLLSGLFFMMFMISCGKDGAEGPAGPAGPAGPQGPAGTGSSTVIYSGWLDVKYKPDTVHTAGGKIDTIGYYATIDAPKLSLALVSTADVKVYINGDETADPLIYPLPYNAASGLYIRFMAYATKIELYSNGDVSTFTNTSNGKKYQQYRYMIVPGNTTARSATVNWSDYASVKEYLGLKD